MSTRFEMSKVTALPTILKPNALYFLAHATDATKFSIHQVNSAGTATRTLDVGTSNTVTITSILADATLTAIDQDVLVNSALGALDIELPPVASNVQIRLFMNAGNNRVRITNHPSDSSGIIIGRNRITMNRLYDSVTLVARAGKWFVAS